MKKIERKQTIKIPTNIKVFYCKKKRIILCKGPVNNKSLKIHKLLGICCKKQEITVVNKSKKKLTNSEQKKIYTLKRTTTSLIQQLLIETTATTYQKLKLVGVGYRAFPVKNFENQLILLKLGYSHSIHFKIMRKTNIFCLKLTKLFVYGSSYQQVTSTVAKIRLNKVPEPYKGKGVLYDNEKIVIKEGKKV